MKNLRFKFTIDLGLATALLSYLSDFKEDGRNATISSDDNRPAGGTGVNTWHTSGPLGDGVLGTSIGLNNSNDRSTCVLLGLGLVADLGRDDPNPDGVHLAASFPVKQILGATEVTAEERVDTLAAVINDKLADGYKLGAVLRPFASGPISTNLNLDNIVPIVKVDHPAVITRTSVITLDVILPLAGTGITHVAENQTATMREIFNNSDSYCRFGTGKPCVSSLTIGGYAFARGISYGYETASAPSNGADALDAVETVLRSMELI